MISEAARDYCQGQLMPRILEDNRHERFDREIMNEMGALGFLGATIDGYGCANINYVSIILRAAPSSTPLPRPLNLAAPGTPGRERAVL